MKLRSELLIFQYGLISLLFFMPVAARQAAAQSPPQTSLSGDAQLRQKLFQLKASELEFIAADSTSTKLRVTDKPVMTWTSLGGWSGDIFVWIGKGRIQVVGCIGAQQVGQSLRMFREFHALADEPIRDVPLEGAMLWRAPSSAEPYRLLPGAPRPAPNTSRRMIQMRNLARQFSVGMRVTTDNVEATLRLLPQPIARETGGIGDVIDSTLFTFVSDAGTDPEAFLLLEARTVGGELQWTYRPARFTTREIWMSRSGVEIWRAAAIESWPQPAQIESEYFYRNEATVTIDAE